MSSPNIKICCISSIAEAQMAISTGASTLGLVGDMPSGPGIIGDDLINEIVKTIPEHIATFLLTSETRAKDIIVHHQKVNTSAIQIVDSIHSSEYPILRKELPKVQLIQVIHVLDEGSIKEAIGVSKYVDVILLDSGNPNLSVKELGGTGRTHNWALSRQIREAIQIPLFLAGGLNPDNIKKAINTVEPFGVDVCSGVRTNGKLDQDKLTAFIKAANK